MLAALTISAAACSDTTGPTAMQDSPLLSEPVPKPLPDFDLACDPLDQNRECLERAGAAAAGAIAVGVNCGSLDWKCLGSAVGTAGAVSGWLRTEGQDLGLGREFTAWITAGMYGGGGGGGAGLSWGHLRAF
jgi:hypothetical protein